MFQMDQDRLPQILVQLLYEENDHIHTNGTLETQRLHQTKILHIHSQLREYMKLNLLQLIAMEKLQRKQ